MEMGSLNVTLKEDWRVNHGIIGRNIFVIYSDYVGVSVLI